MHFLHVHRRQILRTAIVLLLSYIPFAAHHAGVAYWEYDYLNGATDSDNLVRMSDNTWTNILQPAAAAVVQKVAALPVVNGCIPGQLVSCTTLPGASPALS